MRRGKYTFVPEYAIKSLDDATAKTYYGWEWDNILIVVGCLPSELATSRIERINSLKLQLTGGTSTSLPSLHVFGDFNSLRTRRVEEKQTWVTYPTPNLRAQRFYTVKALQLDLVPSSGQPRSDSDASRLDAAIIADPTRLKGLNEKDVPPMHVILNHVNIAPVVDQFVQGKLTASPLLTSGAHAPAKIETVVDSGSRQQIHWNSWKDIILAPLKLLGAICGAPVPPVYSGSTLFKDISATLQQVDVRLEQTLHASEQYEATKLENVQSIARSTARYINFFNCVWLIANDLIIGVAVGGFLCDNKDVLARIGSQLIQRYFIELLREALHWLDNWPVGLKLNTELSGFLCSSFSMTIDYWEHALQVVSPYFPLMLYWIGCGGVFGITMVLSLISDTLSILTLHTYVCYLLATTVFARLLKLLGSLFNLFRGKRRNILRNRTDTWNYDMDQLMLGTILFTLVAFLLPTVTVYYMLFTVTRLGIIGIQACLETVLAFLNHFPLFALMLRVKDPARLPGGIELRFETHNARKTSNVLPSTVVKLVNKPIPYSHIFFQHLIVWSRLSSHYSPLRLLKCALTGALIAPIPRYSIRFGLPSPDRPVG